MVYWDGQSYPLDAIVCSSREYLTTMCKLTVDTSILQNQQLDSFDADDSPIITITSDLSKGVAHSKDAIILRAIIDSGSTEITMANLGAFRQRGRFEFYPDKTETFCWDGKPLIQFQPIEIKRDGLQITASQPYRLLY